MSRKFVLPLIAGLFVANAAFASPYDSWTELDPRARASEAKQMKAQKSERGAPAVRAEEKRVEGKYDHIDRNSP